MEVAIYDQQCVRAGARCYDEELIEQARRRQTDDVFIIRARTRSGLLRLARAYREKARAAGAGPDLFYLRVARTLERAAGVG